jgi:DNA end-binding protein Ku
MRPLWKGHLRLSLVAIPVRMYAACRPRGESRVTFNELHAECKTRLEHRRWCPTCEKFVDYADVAKGHEIEPGKYVIVESDTLKQVRPEASRTIDLVQFGHDAAIDPIYVERPYYLAPDGKQAAAAFSVLREGMREHVGIGVAVMFGREHLVAVRARQRGLVLFLLRRHDEIRPESEVTEYTELSTDVPAQEKALAKTVVQGFLKPLNLADYHDAYEERLRELLRERAQQAVSVTATAAPTSPSAPTNLMDALRQSLLRVDGARKRPAKATLKRPAEIKRKAARRQSGSKPRG